MNRLALSLFALIAASASAEPVLIQHGRVVTNSSAGVIENGDVLMDNGRIVAVGANLTAPRGARVIDATGKWVTPGTFAVMSQLGLYEISGSGAPNDANVSGELASAAADASRAFNPSVTGIAIMRTDGVTRAAVAPAETEKMFGGRGALVSMSGGEGSVFAARNFMMLELGETGASRTGGSRAVLWPAFEAALNDALEYPARYRSGQGGAVLDELDAAALQPFARGQGLFVVHMERASDMRELIAFQRAHPRLNFAIYGGSEAWEIADELAAAKIPVLLNPLSDLPAALETLGARLDNAALLAKAGVKMAFTVGPGEVDPYAPGLTLQVAGNAVTNGLSWDDAFRAVTSAPAEIYGYNDIGALTRGDRADVVVWTGDPLEVTSAPVAMFIDGQEQSLTSRQTQLRDRYNPTRR